MCDYKCTCILIVVVRIMSCCIIRVHLLKLSLGYVYAYKENGYVGKYKHRACVVSMNATIV